MSGRLLVYLAGISVLLSACTAAGAPAPVPNEAAPVRSDTIQAGIDPFAADSNTLTRVDEQGAIVMEVTPIDLSAAADKIEFDVAMNTHSVDLSMDLASVSTLTTDSGLRVAAEFWDAPMGGHHITGTLVFPLAQEALPLLEKASRLTLTVNNVDAPSRVFEWELR